MPPETPASTRRIPTSMPWLLLVLTGLTLTAVIVEAAMVARPSWTLLGMAMIAVLGGVALLVAFLGRVLAEDDTDAVEAPATPTSTTTARTGLRPVSHA